MISSLHLFVTAALLVLSTIQASDTQLRGRTLQKDRDLGMGMGMGHWFHHGDHDHEDNNTMMHGNRYNFTNVTCDTGTEPTKCGRMAFADADGILVCRQDSMMMQPWFHASGDNSTATTMCVDPTRGKESDTCGCCDGDCPEACECECDLKDLDGTVIKANGGVLINSTRHDDYYGQTRNNNCTHAGDNFANRTHAGEHFANWTAHHGEDSWTRAFNHHQRRTMCVSPLQSVTLQVGFRGEKFECGTC